MKKIRMLLSIVFIIMFIWFSLPFFTARIVNVGNFSGGAVCIILALVCLFRERFAEFMNHLCEKTADRIAVIVAGIAIGICLGGAVMISIFMVREMYDKPTNSNTTAVVLGCQVRGRGPSLMLRKRLDTAYEYLRENEDVCVVVSGGQGGDEEISEAECMKNYLTAKGIAEERIYMEDNSTSTLENIRFSKAIIEAEGLPADITIITDGFHQLRADMFAKREGLRSYNVSSHTPLWLLPTYWVREWFGLTYYIVHNS